MLVLSIITWVLSALLALLNLLAGVMKIAKPHGGSRPMPVLDSYTDAQVRAIGVAEIAGALGLILPVLLGVLPWLTPVAALGIASIQFLAILAHRRHHEPFVPNLVIMILAIAVAVLRMLGA